ncbi:MAG: PQQ-binding-like beta-propeller repeat protein [Labilithrix sp.]|nr:PQQ-binding-like beta-propeller repeat protein [Labilithrix sp.]
MNRTQGEIVREYIPIDEKPIHGVTFDGKLVWFARNDELVAFDPETEKIVHRYAIASAGAGTAYDGEHVYQLAREEILVIDPKNGAIVRRLPAPSKGEDSGMAWSDGYLWIGQYRSKKVHKVDAKTGEVVKTLSSDRFVTGVSCTGGALWHGAVGDDQPAELRRLASDGTVDESVTVDVALISGMERTPSGDFWCGGEKGRLRLVRKRARS